MQSVVDVLSSQAPGRRRPVLTAQAVTAAVAAVFVGSTLVGRQGFDPLLDGWLQGTAYALCALLALLRPALSRRGRLMWSLVAAALVARAVAFAVFLGVVRHLTPVPFPSVADGFWLTSCVLLAGSLLALSRARSRHVTGALALDLVVGLCAVLAVALLVLPGTVGLLDEGVAEDRAVLVNAAYPVLDVVLLGGAVSLLAAHRWRPPPGLLALAAGVVGFAVLDSAYLVQVAHDDFRPATPLSGLSLVATLVMALAPWAPAGSWEPGRSRLPGLLAPAGLSLLCGAVLVRAALVPAPVPAVVLSAVGLLAALARTGLAFRQTRTAALVRPEARTDDLTGLPDRRAFSQALDRVLQDRPDDAPLALLVLDVDGFKDVNDTLGHAGGDELLTLLAPRLRLALRPGDVVARTGGDEFAVLVPVDEPGVPEDVAERLRALCRGPFAVGGRSLLVGVTVGIALFPDDSADASELLQHADVALHAAKGERCGQAVYRPGHQSAGVARLETDERLRTAIARGEMVLHYQPKVDLRDGTVVGVEALVRWQHPDLGLLPPSEFLRQTEAAGLMRQLTLALLEQAVQQWAAWRAQGHVTNVAVNLSVGDLLDRRFPAQVEAVLRRLDVPGSALTLELTEDLLLADPARGHCALTELARAGVRVQVDDYGTGFSTLGYLRDLPELSGLKLDRSFVTGIADQPRAAAIVESTLRLASALGLDVVAEGVETEPARELLLALGCRVAQGYLFSRPLPPDEVRWTPVPGPRAGVAGPPLP